MSNTMRLLLSLMLVTASSMCHPGDGNGGFYDENGDLVDADEYEDYPKPARPPKSISVQQRLGQQNSQRVPVQPGPVIPNYTQVNRASSYVVDQDYGVNDDVYGTAGDSLPGMIGDPNETSTDTYIGYGRVTAVRHLRDDDYETPVSGGSSDDIEYEEPVFATFVLADTL